MSAFTKVTTEVEEIEKQLNSIEAEEPAGPSVEKRYKGLSSLEKRLASLKATQVDKFVLKAKEKDPDKVVYGPQMVQKVLEFEAKFEALLAKATELRSGLEEAWQAEDESRRTQDGILRDQAGKEEQERSQEKARKEEEERKRIELARVQEEEERSKRRREIEDREKAEAAREREEAERRAKVLEAQRKKEEAERQAREAKEAAQREAAETMNLDGAIRMLREGFRATSQDQKTLQRVLGVLHTLLMNIVAEPSDPVFRKLRRDNADVQRDLLQYRGAFECLYSLGFREKRIPGSTDRRDGEVLYVMEEPPMENIDVWLAWFEHLKELADNVKEEMDRIRY